MSGQRMHHLGMPASVTIAGRGTMLERDADRVRGLELKAGEWVEVRSREEILTTLDQNGRLENLPFMPEMLQYCGGKFRVFKRADKTCDNIQAWSIRRVKNTVHLEGVRCDGMGHDGCQAGCLIFWKEAWLKRAGNDLTSTMSLVPATTVSSGGCSRRCAVDKILAASQTTSAQGETVYSCQATEVLNFTSYMPWWDPRQYVRDLCSGNLTCGVTADSGAQRAFELMLGLMRILHAIAISLFEKIQARRRRSPYPLFFGILDNTPVETLDLQLTELVQVRSKEEIVATLDKGNRNRGLLFDVEMLRYCGGIYRVLRRVQHIIDEKTGRMTHMKYPCIVLEGVTCQSDYHRLCPRSIYHYWRESWLRRAVELPDRVSGERVTASCEKC